MEILRTPDERFARIVAANTFLPTEDQRPSDAFFTWRDFSQDVEELSISTVLDLGTTSSLDTATRAAYDAPFPDESYKQGARQFPMLVPTSPEDPATTANRRAWEVLEAWDKPFL